MKKKRYHPSNAKEHNLQKICAFPKCKRVGSPETCNICNKPHRRKWCPKHRKKKYKNLNPII